VEARSLTKGANLELPTESSGLQIVVGWADAGEREVDASALLLAGDRRVRSDNDFVFYNQPASPDGSVRHLGKSVTDGGVEERIAVDLEALPDDVHTVAIAASLDRGSFGELDGLHLVALDGSGVSVARYDIADATVETAFVFGEVYRRGSGWKLRAVGQGWDSGLAGLATDFGVTVDDDAAAAPQDHESMQAVADETVALPGGDGGEGLVPGEVAGQLDAGTDADDELVDVVDEQLDEGPVAEVIPLPGVTMSSPPVATKPAAQSPRKGVRTRRNRPAKSMVPTPTLAADPSWHPARLFSVAGIGGTDEQENRATSALLATMLAVRPFARGVVARLGAPAGLVETFSEVQFALGERTVIPDGVIRVARAGRLWTGLLEVKTSGTQLRRDQIEKYLDVARSNKFDAVVTLSNEIAPGAGEHPVAVDHRKLRKVGLFHLSWAEILQEARMVLTHRGVDSPLQAWILAEFIRYLEHPRAGTSGFDDMGPAWVTVREAISAGTLRASDRKAPAVADAWLRLIRFLCLRMTADLGANVAHALPRKLASDPTARRDAVLAGLADRGTLDATLRIPNTAGPLTIVADLRVGQIQASVQLGAPREGSSQRRISWLLRQLGDTVPPDLIIEASFTGRSDTTCEQLSALRTQPALLLADRNSDLTSFRLSKSYPMGAKRSGVRGAFVPTVLAAAEGFYGTVVQRLQPWPPPAPKLSADAMSEAAAVTDTATNGEAETSTTA
jgi:stress response protein SCP2